MGDTIGGTTPGAGNLASGNKGNGINSSGSGNLVQGNWMGITASGTAALGNGGAGLALSGNDATAGGTTAGAANVISGNTLGVVVGNGERISIRGNRIGTDPTGSIPIGNSGDGIQVRGDSPAGPAGAANSVSGNVIAYSGGAGVDVLAVVFDNPNSVSIESNSIFGNAKLGIDLGGDGVTPNTPGGPHPGPNHLQNYPVLTSADSSATATTIIGTLNSTPNSTFTVQFFANPAADPSGFGQGQTYLGQLTGVKTGAGGNASFTFVAPVAVAGEFLSATATDPGGNTSEFSEDLQEGAVAIADLAVNAEPVELFPTGGVYLRFTITDLGPDAAQGVAATIRVPAHTTFQSLGQSPFIFQFQAPPVGGGTGSTITLTAPSLAPGQSAMITLDVRVDPGSAGKTLSDTAVVAALTPDPDTANNVATVSAMLGMSTEITLGPASQQSTFGQTVNFYVSSSSSFVAFNPGGGVTFSVDGIPAGTVPFRVVGEGLAQAVFSTSTIPAGTHRVTAHYNGDGTYLPSDAGPVTLVVDPASTSTVLVAQPNPSEVGQAVTFTAVVAPAPLADGPTGAVTFFVDGVGYTTPLVPSADGLTGTATFTTTALGPGLHGAIARYNGDANFAPSQSAEVVASVSPAAPAAPAPRVVEVLRFGYHAMPTALAVVFNTPLDPASALNLANYQLLGPHRLPVPLASAALTADGTSVVLHPRGRLNVHWTYTLTVLGKPPVGIRSAAGVYAGTNQVELITLRNLVAMPKLPATPRPASRPNPHPHAVDAALASGHLHAVAARGRRR